MAEKKNGVIDRIKNRVKKPAKKKNDGEDIQKLKLLFTVVNRKKADFYTDLLQSMGANMQMSVLARGTADSSVLGYLGLEGNEKTVILSVVAESKIAEIFVALEEKFATIRGGKGIAFTVPFTSVMGVANYRFLSDNRKV